MGNRLSAFISLVVAIIVLATSYFQWWDITFDGKMMTKKWVKILFAVLIIALFVAIILLTS